MTADWQLPLIVGFFPWDKERRKKDGKKKEEIEKKNARRINSFFPPAPAAEKHGKKELSENFEIRCFDGFYQISCARR